MPVTPNFAIPYPDGTTALTPLQDRFADIANAVDGALVTGLAGAPRLATSDSARNALFPSPVQGNLCDRPDKGYIEEYFTLYDASTNPGGATPAGWYPVAINQSSTGTPHANDTGWIQAGASGGPSLSANYTNTVSSVWNGLWVRRRNGVVYIDGSVSKSSAIGVLDTAITMPVGWRPLTVASGVAIIGTNSPAAAIVRVDGTVTTGGTSAGASQLVLHSSYPI